MAEKMREARPARQIDGRPRPTPPPSSRRWVMMWRLEVKQRYSRQSWQQQQQLLAGQGKIMDRQVDR